MTIRNEMGRKGMTCVQSPVAPRGEAGISARTPGADRDRVLGARPSNTAPGLAVISGALSQRLGSFPARGGKMEIALELFIYLYCTTFQKGLKKA